MSLKRFINHQKPFVRMADSDTVMDAIDRMMERGTGAVLIYEEESCVRGIFTERDIMTKVVAMGRDPKRTRLADVMTTDVVMLPAATSLDSAITTMGKNRIRHLPVADRDDNVIGLISLRHLLHEKVEMMVDELNAVDAYHNDAPGG